LIQAEVVMCWISVSQLLSLAGVTNVYKRNSAVLYDPFLLKTVEEKFLGSTDKKAEQTKELLPLLSMTFTETGQVHRVD
jgi:hypothetical protein